MGAIKHHNLQALLWRTRHIHHRGLAIIVATWNEEELTSSITQINIESPSGGDIKVAHPGKVETGHKRITWDVKWENYIGSMVLVSGIPLGYITHWEMPVECTAANKHGRLKYQGIQIRQDWDSDKMAVYTNHKDHCLYGEG